LSPPPKTSGKNLKSESMLQAVILADNFNERFRPITLDRPRSRSYSSIKIITIVTPETRSVGDALRKLDAKQLINSDFILIYFDVSNIHLDKGSKSVDNYAIMSMVVKEGRSSGESPIFVLDGKTSECVHCEALELSAKRRMVMDMEVFKKHADVQIQFIDIQSSTFSMQKDSNDHHLTPKERLLRARMFHPSHLNDQLTLNSPLPSKRSLYLREIYSLFMNICGGYYPSNLKPSNLPLQYDNSEDSTGIVLKSDFGECEILDQLSERDRPGVTGTLEIMAPELLTVDERGRYFKEYYQKSDMWSLGMVLYSLCYSRLPYYQIEDVDTRNYAF
ncbi:17286_t:CDS:2, partial [Cetraspora pellucida]